MTVAQKPADASGPWVDWGDGGISKEEFEEYLARKQARQAKAPLVGQPAPDFEIERLDAHGKQTGKMFRLSSTRGRPVALVFGSYT
jgi:hypothetical protein